MNGKIKVDIVSDVVCPWCVIGYKRLDQAITERGLQDRVEIEWQPFEINPDMPPDGEELGAHTARKYGSTPEDSLRFREQMMTLGEELGFAFDFFEGMHIVNTRDAHVLLEYAKEEGRQTELKLHLFELYFNQHKDVSDRKILHGAIRRIGLDVDVAFARLEDEDARNHVQQQEAFWQRRGISGVPTMIFNQSKGLVGAQPVGVYKEVLEELIGEGMPSTAEADG